MYNILIFGTGKTCSIVESGLNDSVNILAYCDNDKDKWGKIHNNKKIIKPNEICKYNYDYIIIASQFNTEILEQLLKYNISYEKILQFSKYSASQWNYVEFIVKNLIENKKSFNTLITGISYLYKGINVNKFCKPAYNLANPSQDLYYDYNIVKYVLEKDKKQFKSVKNVIIGLCYYSFQYDLSLSSMKEKCCLYYEAIGCKNHFQGISLMQRDKLINDKIGKKIFKFNSEGYLDVNWFYNENRVSNINEENGKKQAIIDCNKNYPNTVKQNTVILRNYLEFLHINNINPIVIVCPVSKYYKKYFSNRIKDEFYNIIDVIRNEFKFQFLDFFDSSLFNDNDFYDVSHLNDIGAEKFTQILNKNLILK